MRGALLFLITASISTVKLVAAQCSLTHNYQAELVVANGWKSSLVSNDLTRPRGIILDKAGNILVIDVGVGLVSYKVKENENGGACLTDKKVVISDRNFNHGIAISDDGKKLFVSTPQIVNQYDYDSANRATSNGHTVISGMQNGGHITRTLYAHGDWLLVSQGSEGNLDVNAATSASGRSTIRAYKISTLPGNGAALAYNTQGVLVGYGLRNSVGVTVDKKSNKMWSVENSVDNLTRGGQQVFQDNPGEELNYHGVISETIEKAGYSGPSHGYPFCVAVWDIASLPDNANLKVGDQIQVEQSSTSTKPKDSDCQDPKQFTAPRLTFQAHMAPLDSQFDWYGEDGGDGGLWVTFHGSWNRNVPIGYKLSKVPFGSNREPVAAATDKVNYEDIMWNRDTSKCNIKCFRPVGVAIGSGGRVYVTSDATGEIFVLWSDAVRGGNAKTEREDNNAMSTKDLVSYKSWAMAAGVAAGVWLW